MKKNKLKIEDWYDILMVRLCSAIDKFDSSKGNFSTWAYKVFDKERMCQTAYNNREMRKEDKPLLSLNYQIKINTNKTKSECSDVSEAIDCLLYSPSKCYNDSILEETKLIIDEMVKYLSKAQYNYLSLYLQGYGYSEIGQIYNVTRQSVCSTIQKAIDMLRVVYYNSELKSKRPTIS